MAGGCSAGIAGRKSLSNAPTPLCTLHFDAQTTPTREVITYTTSQAILQTNNSTRRTYINASNPNLHKLARCTLWSRRRRTPCRHSQAQGCCKLWSECRRHKFWSTCRKRSIRRPLQRGRWADELVSMVPSFWKY